MAGHLDHGEVALAALSYASQVLFMLVVAMMGLSVGTVAWVARAYGAGDWDRVNHVLEQSTLLTIVVSAAVALLGNLLAPTLVASLGGSGEALTLAVQYLRPLLWGTLFYYLTILYAGALRAVRNTMLPLAVGLVGNALNIALNYALMFGRWGAPELGVVGAAVGTVISQFFIVLLTVVAIRGGAVPGLLVRLPFRGVDGPLFKSLLKVGAPAALDMTILMLSFVAFVRMLAWLSQAAVAAHIVGLRIQAIVLVPVLALSRATAALSGNALGAGDGDEARRVVRSAIAMGGACTLLLGAALFLLRKPILGWFGLEASSASEVFVQADAWLAILAATVPLLAVHLAWTGLFRGAGATVTSLVINVIGTLFVQVPFSFLLGFTFGLGAFGVWLALPIGVVAKIALDAWAYRDGRWEQRDA